ncbi:MAG: sorbosone dehydrogenase family protein [Candidatus Dadabacteria bacterium]
MKISNRLYRLKSSIVFVLVSLLFFPVAIHADESEAWMKDWAVRGNFKVSVDAEGFQLPSAIAFVPNPGSGPKDPLYFVTELRGKVMVVTNDRTVHTFAEDFFKLKPEEELPSFSGETGLAGICLDPVNGYVFVTFAYQDENNILRNNMVRFESEPETFSLKAKSATPFTDIFVDVPTTPSHQIGPCQVYDNTVFVTLGDGHSFLKSRDVDSILGKVLRMTPDGKPVTSNPFYVDDDIKKPRNYVWAYGFRNPFSLKVVDGRVFVADNGLSSDRFLEARKGVDYLWDGSNWSIGVNADFVINPSVGTVQMDYYPEGLEIFPEEYRGRFYLVMGGNLSMPGPGQREDKSIAMLNYGFKEDKLLTVPKLFMRYTGDGNQILVGVGIGPDGLYYAPILPDSSGFSSIYKITYDESDAYPNKLDRAVSAEGLLDTRACYGCHVIDQSGWGTAGPRLNRDTLPGSILQRLDSPEYRETVKKLDELDIEPYKTFRHARQEVLQKEGIDKVRTWVKFRLLEPRFDNPYSQMPNLGLTDHEATLLSDYLIKDDAKASAPETAAPPPIEDAAGKPGLRYLVYSFIVGFSLCGILAAIYVSRLKKSR